MVTLRLATERSAGARSCYTRFNHIVNYSELKQGNRGEAVAFNTTDATATIGNDECEWNIISNIVVE